MPINNSTVIRKGAFFVAVASLIFTIIAAIINFLYLEMTIIGAPLNYLYYSVLISVLPYLFVGVLALIISVVANDTDSPVVTIHAATEPSREHHNE